MTVFSQSIRRIHKIYEEKVMTLPIGKKLVTLGTALFLYGAACGTSRVVQADSDVITFGVVPQQSAENSSRPGDRS